MNPTSNQIQNKSLVSGATLTDALNTLRITSGGSGSGDMSRSVYDTDSDGKVDVAELADSVPWTGVTGKPSTFPPQTHSHTTTDVVGLDTALAGKAATSHTHTISNVTGLQTALDGKAATSHTHVITDVTDLQTTLDGKANLSGDNTFTGSVNYSGSAKRFKADFSTEPVGSRFMFQTSTVNGVTGIYAVPNGTSKIAAFAAAGGSDPANAPVVSMTQFAAESRIAAAAAGAGAFTPLTFYAGGAERARFDTSGNVGIGAIPPTFDATHRTLSIGKAVNIVSRTDVNAVSFATNGFYSGTVWKYIYDGPMLLQGQNAVGDFTWYTGPSGVAGATASLTNVMLLTNTGNLTLNAGAFGYGTGAGGTGTVAAGNVVINKPSGIVTYSGLTLNAGAAVMFDITSSYASGDCIGVATMAKTTSSYWEYECNCIASGAGSMTVMLRNISGTNKTGVTVYVNFAIFKHSQS